ncbi:MAG: hypothetical protein ABSE40_23730 [Candidatus Sulfotelmatobacter sp.]
MEPSHAAKALLNVLLLAAPQLFASDCIPICEASQHVGETKCVTGKVVRVKAGASSGRVLSAVTEPSGHLALHRVNAH